jgi:hypothetical protein
VAYCNRTGVRTGESPIGAMGTLDGSKAVVQAFGPLNTAGGSARELGDTPRRAARARLHLQL